MSTTSTKTRGRGGFVLLFLVPTILTGVCVWLAYDAGESLPLLISTGLTSFIGCTSIEGWWRGLAERLWTAGEPRSTAAPGASPVSLSVSLIQSLLSLLLAGSLALVAWYAGVSQVVPQQPD